MLKLIFIIQLITTTTIFACDEQIWWASRSMFWTRLPSADENKHGHVRDLRDINTMCVYMYLYMCIYMYMYIYIHIHIYTHIHIHIYIRTYIQYIHLHTYTYVYCVYIYTHIHAYTILHNPTAVCNICYNIIYIVISVQCHALSQWRRTRGRTSKSSEPKAIIIIVTISVVVIIIIVRSIIIIISTSSWEGLQEVCQYAFSLSLYIYIYIYIHIYTYTHTHTHTGLSDPSRSAARDEAGTRRP